MEENWQSDTIVTMNWLGNLEILKRTLPPCPALSHCRPGFQNRYYQASALGRTGIGFTRVHSGSVWLSLTWLDTFYVTFGCHICHVCHVCGKASGYQGSRVLEHNQTGRFSQYVEAIQDCWVQRVVSMFDQNLKTLFFIYVLQIPKNSLEKNPQIETWEC